MSRPAEIALIVIGILWAVMRLRSQSPGFGRRRRLRR